MVGWYRVSQMKAVAVLVGIVTRNRAMLLTRAIASVKRQSWSKAALVVIDDGSEDETVNLPNQNTCPEVLASVNFLWGNPMINKTAFPIKPIYPAYIAPTISEGYGISDRYSSIFLKNLQFICKTWGGNDGPMNGSIFSLRVSR